ncbi:helix-turn-helix transcriptional regulator [Erysipelotrichaceae bacterium HCN-30851]
MKKRIQLKNEINIAIKEAMIYRNLTQKQVAKAIGVAPQTLSSYIHNRRIPNAIDLYHLVHVLDLDIEYLFDLKQRNNVLDYRLNQSLKLFSHEQKQFLLSFLESTSKKRSGNDKK